MHGLNTIYIIGFMGCGKSTTGKKLASYLNWTFVDLDGKIEEFCGKTIPQIFSEDGESYFRQIESEVLKNLNTDSKTVISTGGGAPCFEDNMDFMLNKGLTIYLKLTPAQLKKRLIDSKGKRPLIDGLNSEELHLYIEEKLAFRELWYNRAEITYKGFNADVKMLYGIVKKRINS